MIELWIYLFIIVLPLMGYYLKLSLFPQNRGRILEFLHPMLNPKLCSKEGFGKQCFTSIKIRVEMDDGRIEEAWISPCSICLEKLKLGSRVAINKLGSKYIATPLLLRC